MTLDVQTWMRAVWTSIMEPSATARQVMVYPAPRHALWTALALVAVLNVIVLALLQYLAPSPSMEGAVFSLSPFAYLGVFGVFLVLFVSSIHQVGRFFGGTGSQVQTLAIVVWSQAIGLTLEGLQIVLALVSPAFGALFGLMSLGALVWVFLNFVNVLHGFGSLGKAAVTLILSLIVTALGAGFVLGLFGVGPSGAMT